MLFTASKPYIATCSVTVLADESNRPRGLNFSQNDTQCSIIIYSVTCSFEPTFRSASSVKRKKKSIRLKLKKISFILKHCRRVLLSHNEITLSHHLFRHTFLTADWQTLWSVILSRPFFAECGWFLQNLEPNNIK